jgi:hypothetical protein
VIPRHRRRCWGRSARQQNAPLRREEAGREAQATGYDEGKSEAEKQQYWLYVSMQRQRNQVGSVRLYLHIVDTVETAGRFGVTLNPRHPDAKAMSADPTKVADPDTPFARVLEHWLPLTCALNSLNRGMGLPDLYPFVLSGPAIGKLEFVHEVVQESRAKGSARSSN